MKETQRDPGVGQGALAGEQIRNLLAELGPGDDKVFGDGQGTRQGAGVSRLRGAREPVELLREGAFGAK
jgi:hypothetical protein